MKGIAPFAVLLALLLLGPIAMHRGGSRGGKPADETLVIITPHNEATRYEFGRAFSDQHFARTGRHVFVDWRTVGGTSELASYINAQYLGRFRDYWTRVLEHSWTPECASFDDARAVAPGAVAARKAFLASNVGCGVDLFFGGGSFDYMRMASSGKLVDSGVMEAHPELFAMSGTAPLDAAQGDTKHIPQSLGGEPLWDPKGCWMGACLGAFGICYNVDSLARLGIAQPPMQWADLASPAYAREVALADPTQSGSVAKAFEMIMQQQIAEADGKLDDGWMSGMRMIQKISANARYFTNEATEIPYSVEAGDAAAGMCIDFYGRFESEAVRKPDGTSRLVYVTPRGGSSTGADSVALFRGAPHPTLAKEFMDFVISQAGQKLWCFRAGAPGGPEKYTLRRLPIRPDLYEAQWRPYEADPQVDPFAQRAPGTEFVYRPKWTGSLFGVISFVIKTAFIDPHDELAAAWSALIAAHFPPQATETFSDLSAIDYAQSSGVIREALASPDKLASVVLAWKLDDQFRDQYRRAAELARRGL